MTDVDMDSYREHNDIPPGEPAPRAPDEQPDGVNENFRVWMFDAEQSTDERGFVFDDWNTLVERLRV